MTDFDDSENKITHEVGSDLDALSVEELELRIGLMEHEIGRLRQSIASKGDSLSAAESFFKS